MVTKKSHKHKFTAKAKGNNTKMVCSCGKSQGCMGRCPACGGV